MHAQSVDSVLISALVTSLVSSFGLGMLLIQTGFYLLNLGNRETRLERATVALLLLIMLARTGCDVSGAFRAISGRFANSNYQIVPKALFETVLSPLFGVIIIGICHIFISNRILSFASSVKTSQAFLRSVVMWVAISSVVASFCIGVASVALIWQADVSSADSASAAKWLAAVRGYTILSAFYSLFCCCLDIFLAWIVSFEVKKSKSRSDTNSDRVLVSLLRNSIYSTFLTAACQITKTALLFVGQTGWAGTCFSLASSTYSVFLLLSISLPRNAGDKHSKPSSALGTPSALDISSMNQFFSSNSNPNHSNNTADHTRNDSDEKAGTSWDLEPVNHASKGSRSPDVEMGLGEMLAYPPPHAFTSSYPPTSAPPSLTRVRIKMPARNRSFLGASTSNPPYAPSSPATSFVLDDLPPVHNPVVSRQSSLVRSVVGKESRNRKKAAPTEGLGVGGIGEGEVDEPRSTGELNISYILSGLMVQSIKDPSGSSGSRR